jgi:hypothetical protein
MSARAIIEAAPAGTPNPHIRFHGVTLRDFLGDKWDEFVAKRQAIWAQQGPLWGEPQMRSKPHYGAPHGQMLHYHEAPFTRKGQAAQELDNEYDLGAWRNGAAKTLAAAVQQRAAHVHTPRLYPPQP